MELRNTYIYHSIKPIIFGALCAIFAIVSYLVGEYAPGVDKAVLIVTLTLTGVMAVLFFVSVGMLASVASYDLQCQAHEYDVQTFPYYCIVVEGAPGAGKTDTIKREAIIRAEYNYALLREEYFLMYNTLPDIIEQNDVEALIKWHEVKNTYEYYMNHPDIFPCLISNVPMTVDGRKVLKFSFAYLVQEANLGYRTVAIIDETRDAGVTNEDSANLPREIDEFFRFIRQFYEATVYCTEQNKARVVLALRCVAVNYTMETMQKGILRPILLEKHYNRLFNKYYAKYGDREYILFPKKKYNLIYDFNYYNMRKYSISQLMRFRPVPAYKCLRICFEQNPREVAKLIRLKQLINSIGFIKYARKVVGGTQGNVTVNQATQEGSYSQQKDANIHNFYRERYYMPASRRYKSDTRMFKKLNKAYDMRFNPDNWGYVDYVDRDFWDENLKYRSDFSKKSRNNVGEAEKLK